MGQIVFALPDMDQDRSTEWSEGPSASVGGAGFTRKRTDAGNNNDVGDSEDADVLNWVYGLARMKAYESRSSAWPRRRGRQKRRQSC